MSYHLNVSTDPMVRLILAYICIVFYSSLSLAQEPIQDVVLDDQIKTVELFKKGFPLSYPILELGTQNQLTLRFDDLSGEPFNLSYTLVHCNADWVESSLTKTEYIQGSFTELIPSGRQSFGTLQPFIHYGISFPNQFMNITRSGNYIIKVHVTGDEEDVLFTKRFLVFQKRVGVKARIVAARDVQQREEVQQIELSITHPGVLVQDPFSDLKVVALQNMRWEDARTDIKPMFIRADEIVYDRPINAAFLGLNEWRNFDLKDFSFVTQEVLSVRQGEENYEAVLLPDPKRNISVYLEEADINGRFLIKNDQAWDQVLGADYVNVKFTLPMTAELTLGNIYVYGAFSDLTTKEEFKMSWNETTSAYELNALLKQGYYNYLYAYKGKRKDSPIDLKRIEGSRTQTENEYQVLVYLTDIQTNTDKLVGIRFFNSRRDR